MSITTLAIPILAIGVFFVAVLSAIAIQAKRRLMAWFTLKIEKLSFDNFSYFEKQFEDDGPRFAFFPMANATCFLIVLDIVFSWLKDSSGYVEANIATADAEDLPFALLLLNHPISMYLAAGFLAAYAFYFHISRRGTRNRKYDLILTTQLFLLQVWVVRSVLVQVNAHKFAAAVISTTACWGLFIVFQFAAAQLVRRMDSHRQAFSLYYIIQHPILRALFIISPVLLIYMLVRYHLLKIVSRRPILYFRSFHYQNGPMAFGKIISKAARRFGLIEGLVHHRQLASSLQSSVDITEQGRFYAATEKEWKNWVQNRLQSGIAVIIDQTEDTEHLKWEIEQAVNVIGLSRVAILCGGTRSPDNMTGTYQLKYILDRNGTKKARRELQLWLKRALLSSASFIFWL
jgi:hypothetical protein